MELIKGMMEREMGVHVFAASALVAGALGFEVLPDLTAPAEPVRAAVFATAAPTLPLRAGAAGRMVANSALVEKPKTASPKPLGLEEFIGMAKKAAPQPLAKKFTDEFVGEPALREALVDFRREEGVNAPAADFLKKVARLPEFGDLLGRFRSEPGFRGAFLSLAKEPKAEEALRSIGSLSTAEAAPAKRERKAGHKVTAARISGQKGLGSEAAGSSQKVGGSTAVAAPGSSSTGGPSSAAPSSSPSASYDTTSANLNGARNAPGVPAIGSTHDVGGIKEMSSVDRTRDSGNFFESLFATASPELKAKLDYQCTVNNICNPIEACVAAGAWDECVAACNANARCTGILPQKAPENVVARVAEELGLDDGKKPQDLKGEEENGKKGLDIKIPDLANFKAEEAKTWYQGLAAAIDGGIGSALGYALGYLWDGVDGGPKGAAIGREIGEQIGVTIAKGVETVLSFAVKGVASVVGGAVGAVGSILTGGGIKDAFEGAVTGWDVGGKVGGAILDWAGGATKAVGGWFGGLFS